MINSKSYDFTDLPEDIHISTITITCHVNTDFYVNNIGKYLKLKPNGITMVKYCKIVNGEKKNCIRTINKEKKRRNNSANINKKIFNNQITIKVTCPNNTVSIKLFKNGSIQITGCKSINMCTNILQELFDELLNNYNDIILVSKKENLTVDKIVNFKIRMINCNFNVNFNIDRKKLHNYLENNDINSSFEPLAHSAVNIKYNYKNENKISILVFKRGAIIITGALKKEHIIAAYEFIVKTLYEQYSNIVVYDIDSLIREPTIQQFIKDN